MDVGAVGGLRNVRNAISVARKVLKQTKHSLIVGDSATQFAINMGFKNMSLQTNETKQIWKQWKSKKCQPNFSKVLREKTCSFLAYFNLLLLLRYSCAT